MVCEKFGFEGCLCEFSLLLHDDDELLPATFPVCSALSQLSNGWWMRPPDLFLISSVHFLTRLVTHTLISTDTHVHASPHLGVPSFSLI